MTATSGDTPLPSLADAPWLGRHATQAVLSAIESGGYAARVVGGAVRNELIGAPVKDIDVATTAEPREVMRLVEHAGLKAVPTGIEHGTVTVITDHTPLEVTTLRRDIETFGRHARVTFTTDWVEDARRRDFTINAFYCDRTGAVHDPLGGYPDLLARVVRFIGDPHDRIREDYLRILRFFRFTAEYARGAPDAAGLEASVELAAGLSGLSAERIRAEMLRLLAAPRAVDVVDVMEGAGLASRVLGIAETGTLRRLTAIEAALAREPDALLRLAALAAARPGRTLELREKLRLSSAEYERLARMALPDKAFDPEAPEREAKAFIYRHGSETFRDGMLLAWTNSSAPTDDARWRERLSLPERWTAPALPVRGADVMEAGLAAGPAVGRVMRTFEDWWIAEDFPTEHLRLAYALSRFVKANRD
ncbi:MAG: CCA tRNA nucleotidyltransferase [Hyphomicrobium sp.]|jgi:poly(A) polymerase